jgi:hypothetical protein
MTRQNLKSQIEAFKQHTVLYPESVHVNRTYRTRSNRVFVKRGGLESVNLPYENPQQRSAQDRGSKR